MSSLACMLWWLLLGSLLGLLGSWLIGKLFRRPMPAPTERIVEKHVDRLVDNPAHLTRIKALEGEVAGIAGMRSQIQAFQSAPPKIVEKIVDRPVDRIVEKIVDRPVEIIVEKIVEKPVDRIVEKIVEKPVDRIVEKIVEKPVDRIVEKAVDRVVDNPAQLTRIRSLEAEVAVIAGLTATIQTLRSAPPKVVEKIVEKIVEKPVDRIVEKIVDRPVEKIVEKIVDRQVDNPAQAARIRTLEHDLAVIPGLRGRIKQLEEAPPKVVEKVVEKIVDRPVEKIVEKPVDRIVEKIIDRPVDRIVEKIVDRPVDRIVEKLVPDTKGLEERDARLRDLTAKLSASEEEARRLRLPPTVDMAAAKAAGFALKNADDLEIIEGIGPKIADLLRADGIKTFYQLAQSTPERIRVILDKAGPNYRIANPGTWPEQAELAARNRWQALWSLHQVLDAGVRVEGDPIRERLAAAEAELKRLREPVKIDIAAAKAAGFTIKGADDLEVIEGIGPKIAELLHAAGIHTFAELAVTPVAKIQSVLAAAGANYKLAKPDTWPEQSDLAARNRWATLKALQDQLNAGNRND
jgi:predicted flap endonuclease-1-like 5' DNA nuclease